MTRRIQRCRSQSTRDTQRVVAGGRYSEYAGCAMLRSVLLLALVTSVAGLSVAEIGGGTDDFWSRRDALQATYAERLKGLSDRCLALKLDEAAKTTREEFRPRDPRRQYIFLPAETDPAKPPADAPKIVQQWYEKFSSYRREHAEALFQLARNELHAESPHARLPAAARSPAHLPGPRASSRHSRLSAGQRPLAQAGSGDPHSPDEDRQSRTRLRRRPVLDHRVGAFSHHHRSRRKCRPAVGREARRPARRLAAVVL